MCENIIDKTLTDSLKLRYPSFYKDAAEFVMVGPFEIIIKTEDGKTYLYDDLEETITKLSSNRSNISENEFRRQFSIRLHKTMKRRQLTQYDLSDITGITQTTISKYIAGKATPSFYNIDKISKALNCTIEDLMYVY